MEEQQETKQNGPKESPDPFTRLMFGNSPRFSQSANKNSEEVPAQPSNQVDYMSLMKQVDEIMGSVNRIKPMFKEIGPLLDLFKKR
ncbi:hypothetical protein IMZ08_14990 [Bacillus luteolus]|uniref:Spore coat protein n=1 Tax=Litchfieldia luteola TaxID=682179 RepID=A0ABR9QLG4_9BACI|nr:hypothetical protein [Cytobacillus luteolus]MBE4909355.1 hypothetical protein [Cytobacillus luteolus]MBP1940751.1 hypothetical protein [Cytobacillus luteolus]